MAQTPHTIGNPLSWAAQQLSAAGSHVSAATRELGTDHAHTPRRVRTMAMSDISDSLRAGWEDFKACRSDVLFIVLIYPVMGLLLMGMAFHQALLPLLFPMAAGFAIIGPMAAIGLYEMSRKREMGLEATWRDAFAVLGSPAFGAMLVMGLYLVALFCAWMLTAHFIHLVTMGPATQQSMGAFLSEVFNTTGGWWMIVLGCGVGFVFALVALAVSVVSFQLLLHRHVGAPVAVMTSVHVLQKNPKVVLCWGAVIAVMLVLGSLPLLLGLMVVLPLLGHASWHFYRRAVA
ncbi:DUF2189 domain-containing protein [Alloyangia pacifica]|uniref:Uncharacterized membrane protein n=1 Tax=Alloyangia pacifica TaxID=311180 RepID=A0A1I6S2A1_9RHOB|nr:DUF2189 domain-containing protein [Alloyangia pacifica]SDG69466.1 Uncharacterized membrane protein [Alloyangia pacifica]SFS71081.1 Uncharacterized membrane protein [Alloyangia pacifica]